jgi:hypothetical protein
MARDTISARIAKGYRAPPAIQGRILFDRRDHEAENTSRRSRHQACFFDRKLRFNLTGYLRPATVVVGCRRRGNANLLLKPLQSGQV